MSDNAHTAFRGRYDHRLDDKGRLTLPIRFKDIFFKEYDKKIYLTSIFDGDNIRIYPLERWGEIEERLRKLPPSSDFVEAFSFSSSYFGQECTMDTNGRILIPESLRTRARMSDDVTLVGMVDYIQLYDRVVAEERAAQFILNREELKRFAVKVGL